MFAISSFFSGLLQNLLPYLLCLLYGCRLNAALHNGDALLRLNATWCFEEHNQLEREGRRYKHTLKLVLKRALDIGIIKRKIDLSVDPTFLIYWGKEMVKRWGTVFSTMYNRSLPGLFPLTCFDLKSGLFLWMDDFIGKARRDRKGRIKNLGKVVGTKVLKCIDFLKQSGIGISVRSVTGDEGITSKFLLNELKERKIKHLFALKRPTANIRNLVVATKKWSHLKDGRLIAIRRNIKCQGVRTNLVIVRDEARKYLYLTSYRKSAKYGWRKFGRRGCHENGIGGVKSIGLEDGRPSTNLFQIKGHALACTYLLMLLKALSEKLNLLGENKDFVEPKTIRNLFARECYVRWEAGRMVALVVVSRKLLERIGTSRIEWEGGTIELLWLQYRNVQATASSKMIAKG
ncbi:MAG: hypothetical protein ACREBS_01620 [Nitrososphaerales archaeon]